MGKWPYIAGGRKDKEFMMEVEEERLDEPCYNYVEECPSPVIQLAETRRPRRVPPTKADSATGVAPTRVVPAVTTPATETDDAGQPPQPQGPSRKERKRMAARERARHTTTLAEMVVEEGRVVDESEYIADPAMAFPIAGLPLDIVRDVLLFYIDARSIVNAMAASRGFRVMMEDDLLWRDIFRTHSLEQLDRRLWRRVRNRAKTWSQKSMLMTRVVSTAPEERRALELKAKRREELQKTEESAELRRMLKQRTDEWDEIEELFYVRGATGHISASHKRPQKPIRVTTIYCGVSYRTWSYRYVPDHRYHQQYVKKSKAYPVQYRCPHARVGYCKDKHQVVCLDCNVRAHTVAVPHNVYVF